MIRVEEVGGAFIVRKGSDQVLVLSEEEAVGLIVKLRRALGWERVELIPEGGGGRGRGREED